MNICICDDDLTIHEKIEQLIKNHTQTPSDVSICKATGSAELMKLFGTAKKPDIVFLDIEMPRMNGIQTAEKIREISKKTILIFVSSHTQYVFDTFRLDAFHFLRKPITLTEFNDVFGRALNKHKTCNAEVSLRFQGERCTLPIDSITYVEGYNRHIMLHTENENFESVGRLRDIFPELEMHGFIYVHQGYIVNMNYIRHFRQDEIILQGGKSVPVSVRKRQTALKLYDEFIQKRMW